MASMEEAFEEACKNRAIPGAVVLAESGDGSFHYANTFGSSLSTSEDSASTPLSMDSVFSIASCTKLLTSICALQCVERGLVNLDDDVKTILPELAELPVLGSFDDDGRATTTPRKNPITLRLLLSHSAGLGYEFMSPKLQKYRRSQRANENVPRRRGTSLLDQYTLPLLFEPGTSWGYSCAIDWAGRLVERLANTDLEAYMRHNILTPLGITDITFWPSRHPGMQARLAGVTIREPVGSASGPVVPYTGPRIADGAVDCLGGGGAFATMPAYLKVLRSLLRDDEKLLRRATAAQMFAPQLAPPAARFLESLRDRPEVWGSFVGHFPRHVGLDWGLGGILTTCADAGWRGNRTMMWSGLPNLFWFIDRETGLCGVFGTQVMPPGDAQTNEMITLFERTMYQRFLASQKSRL